jgi:hypothetical protein
MTREHAGTLDARDAARPTYVPPQIVAYDEAALEELIGPAIACASWTGSPSIGGAKAEEDEDF